jgi:hypothetical protein
MRDPGWRFRPRLARQFRTGMIVPLSNGLPRDGAERMLNCTFRYSREPQIRGTSLLRNCLSSLGEHVDVRTERFI